MIKSDLIELFKDDSEFINNYSIYNPQVENVLETVVDDTWLKIGNLKHHHTEYGYFAIDDKDLVPWIVGFYVKPEFRKNNSLAEDMKNATNGMFIVAAWNENTRAINFLNRFCKQMNKDNSKTTFYFMRGNLCL